MKIEHYTITTFGGYNSILKDMYKDGRLPSVKVVYMVVGYQNKLYHLSI